VQAALTSATARLKLHKNTPNTGLALFVGTIVDGSRERLVSIGVTHLKPISRFIYRCDKRFHVDELQAALEVHETIGFIVVDGEGATFTTLAGAVRKTVQRISVDLPKRHTKGGQSAPRFQRLRLEKRAAFVKQVAELATRHFVAAHDGQTSPAPQSSRTTCSRRATSTRAWQASSFARWL
jgi:peptide chain release factor subunit 1